MLKSKFIPMVEIARLAVQAGFKGWYVVTITGMCWVESRGNVWAVGLNSSDPTHPAYLSLDLGLVQWNTFYHPNITSQQAFDPAWSLKHMWEVTSAGTRNLDLWGSHSSGAYRTYAHDALLAAREVGVPI